MAEFIKQINKTWTLFLDRDGVLNEEIKGDYVRNPSQLKIFNYVPDAIAKCNSHFANVIVVTNQRGVGKGLYTQDDVEMIHEKLYEVCEDNNAYIDAFYYSTALDASDSSRKPNTGMAIMAQEDFPEINFAKSIMIGNNISDMQFGRNAGMKTVLVETTQTIEEPNELIDLVVKDLKAFADML
jgi:HAD superfamily hydrolase (TIGR01662 family)